MGYANFQTALKVEKKLPFLRIYFLINFCNCQICVISWRAFNPLLFKIHRFKMLINFLPEMHFNDSMRFVKAWIDILKMIQVIQHFKKSLIRKKHFEKFIEIITSLYQIGFLLIKYQLIQKPSSTNCFESFFSLSLSLY